MRRMNMYLKLVDIEGNKYDLLCPFVNKDN